MKKSKIVSKVVTVLLSLMMAVACAIPAFAADTSSTTSDLTIGNIVVPAATQESISNAAKQNPVLFPVEEALSIAGGASSVISGAALNGLIFANEFTNEPQNPSVQ